MDEPQSDIPIEDNAPPSIELNVGNIVTNQPVTLAGETNQTSPNLFNLADPQNVSFVMGPNGQMIAIEKPPFVWKHFLIGGGIPFAIFFVPMMILMIGAGLDYDDDGDTTREVTLFKDENSTAYRGEFTLEEDNFLSWCGIRYNLSLIHI